MKKRIYYSKEKKRKIGRRQVEQGKAVRDGGAGWGEKMATLDIGIDLGTSVMIGMDSRFSVKLIEPAVAAVDTRTGKVIVIGGEVYKMIGRTPPHIRVVHPLMDGVISDFEMTGVMIKHVLKKICTNALVKPRVTVCVPSGITGVESQAVLDATVAAGARKVYLIEEPVAAAIGAGVELARPNGNLIVDIGGGTCDIAVLSLNGIVCKTSLKVAGLSFDKALIKYMRSKYNMLIGERTAERVKMEIGSVDPDHENIFTIIKGRDLLTGLPKQMRIFRKETLAIFKEPADQIVQAVQGVLEKTPPELVGDIRENGLILTGGGSLLDGLDTLLEEKTRVAAKIAENPQECVAIGTAKSFDYLDKLYDGFVSPSTHVH